ncbi:MAG: hypothetical protein EAZ97_12755 [Bacteroidetes bacterium]|nr:MAG: hypothetical protein EAZ97_12755 [Bacteroidota bacterium]
MKVQQDLKNHVRYHPIYHFGMIPLGAILVGMSIYLAYDSKDLIQGLFFLIASVLLFLTMLMSRINALAVQNRVVRLEMRVRYFQLTGLNFQEKEAQLSLSQIIALRFAGDEEFLELLEKTIAEKLTSPEIKKRVKNWTADYYRV